MNRLIDTLRLKRKTDSKIALSDSPKENTELIDPVIDEKGNWSRTNDIDKQIADFSTWLSSWKEGQPNYLRRITSLSSMIIESEDFDPTLSPNGETNDYRLSQVIKMAKLLGKKLGEEEEIEKRLEFIFYLVEMKRNAGEILNPGNLLATGTYCDDIASIAKAGGLMSSVHRINKGFITAEKAPRFGHADQPDASAVFFQPWQYPGNDRRNFVKAPGVYESGWHDFRGTTDLTIIFPVTSIIRNSKAVVLRGELNWHSEDVMAGVEVAVTSSNTAILQGQLTSEKDDETFLPLREAFLIVPREKEKEVKNSLRANGFDDEWQNGHLFVVDNLRRFYIDCRPSNNMRYILQERRKEISAWIQDQVPLSKHEEIKLTAVPKNMGYSPYVENLYRARIV